MNIQLAKKLNREIIKNAKTPHERDLSRMRLNIIKKVERRKEKWEDIVGIIMKAF